MDWIFNFLKIRYFLLGENANVALPHTAVYLCSWLFSTLP